MADSSDGIRRGEGDFRELDALHAEIDRAANSLAIVHADRLQCRRGCSDCCVDDLTVAAVEAERIRRAHSELLRQAVPHPVGRCAFLDDLGACRIYPERPYVCRTQGLPLRILFENEVGEIEERRDICPLNLDGGPPLEELDEHDCWLIGPFELKLGGLDDRWTGGKQERIALRSLFESD